VFYASKYLYATTNLFIAVNLILVLGLPHADAQSTVALNESLSVNSSPMKVGVAVSSSNYYDAGQLFKNLLAAANPGFEGFIQQEIVGCISGSTTTCVNNYQWDQAPLNYWAGATAYFCCSASSANPNFGLTRTISSSTTSAGSTGPTYTFTPALPNPVATDDYFSVTHQVDSTGSSIPGWQLSGSAAGETSNVPPGSSGLQALSLPSGACASGYADTTGSHDYLLLQTGQTFGFSLKTIAISGNPVISVSITRLNGLGGGVSPASQSLSPSASWTTQPLSFNGAENTGVAYGDLEIRLCNTGTGTAYVDDADFERTSNLNASNTSVYRDEVVASLEALNPGSLRLWDYQLGETLADWTNPIFGRHFQSSLQGQSYVTATSGRNAGSTAQGLTDFLGLCELIGAKPWITIPVSWPAADYSNLIDFLAGGANTVYGAKRIASGHPATYGSTLGTIYIEFGNEPWNSVFAGINMPNFSYATTSNGMLSYGHWSGTAMSVMKGNSNYSSAFRLIVNMQAVSTYEYTNHILPNNSYLDAVSVAPYIGTGQLNSAATLDAEWNPDTAFAWGDSNDTAGSAGNGWTYAYVAGQSKPVYIYEDNENQISGSVTTAVLQNHSSSFMAGTTVAQQMLEHLKILGPNAPQNIWSLAQDQFTNSSSVSIPLYGIIKEAGGEWSGTGGFIQRPLALATQIANDSIIGPEYSSSVTNPDTYSTGPANGFAAESRVPYEFAYCFKNNSSRSCVLVNTDPVNSHTFVLTGDSAPSAATTRTLSMAGNTIDTCNNESATACVSIVTTQNVSLPGGVVTVGPGTIEGLDFAARAAASPIISSVAAGNIGTTTAAITWTTDQPSSSQVNYGTTTAYGSVSALSSSLVTLHSVILTGLTPGTAYNYAAISADAGGAAASGNFTFITAPLIPVLSVISPVGGAHGNTGSNPAPTSLSIPYSSQGGNTIVAVCALGSTASSVASITDSGSFWAFRAFVNNGSAVRTEIWSTAAGGSVASQAFKISFSSGAPASCALEEYAGVQSIGTTATTEATSGNWSVSLATQDPGDYVVAGIGANSYYGYTTISGTSRQLGGLTSNAGNNYAEIALCDSTAATPSVVSCSSVSGPAPWAAPAVELRSTGATPVPAPIISAISAGNATTTSDTITWTTSQPSSSQVEFGTSAAYGSMSALNTAPVTSHSVTLTGLTAGTSYNYAVISTDSGGSATSANLTFSTPAAVVPAPVISSVASGSITTTTATITWTTDQLSSSQVEFGTSTAYGSVSALNTSPVTSHSVTLTGLTPGTFYNYAAISTDSGGTTTSANLTFSTFPSLGLTAISPVGGAHGNTGSNPAPGGLSIAYSSQSGNTVVAVCALGNITSSVATITDSGSSWALRAAVNNGSAVRTEIWSTGAGNSVASKSFNIGISGPSPASCAIEEYAGVQSLGTTATSEATSGNWSVSLATQDPNDYVVAGIGANSYYGYTTISGTARQLGGLTANAGNNYVEIALCDNTAAMASVLSCTAVSGSAAWAAPALELR
jgi:hypothetical protein